MRRTAFIGHRDAYLSVEDSRRLREIVEKLIASGCKCFTMGTHGNFDRVALSVCKEVRKTHPEIKIEVVLSSFHMMTKDEYGYSPYEDVDTVMYDVEEVHYKRQIIYSNRRMIDNSDTLICYIREWQSWGGARAIMEYAKRKGLRIINIADKK